jgi:predicted MFS family arabinose efflux permease
MGGRRSSGLATVIATITLTRLFINTARRFAYPFAPVLSRSLGVSLPAITGIIAVNQLTGIIALFFGPMGDRWGYRNMMLAGLGLLVIGMFSGWLFPFYGMVLTALFLSGLGKTVFDPAIQAYIGNRVPYSRRGMVIGIIETSWAGSTLAGVPLVGLLMDHFGWRSPFLVLSALGIVGMLLIVVFLPAERKKTEPNPYGFAFLLTIRRLLQKKETIGAVCFSFLFSAANDNLLVVYGAWLEKSFALSVVALGATTIIIGAAELIGEMTTAFLADRAGLVRVIASCTILMTASYFVLPFLGGTLFLALAALFFLFVSLECSIVTAISLYTEILPDARATMMAGHLAAASLGRVAGAMMGGPIWLNGGIHAVGIVSAALSGMALLVLLWGFTGWRRMVPSRT